MIETTARYWYRKLLIAGVECSLHQYQTHRGAVRWKIAAVLPDGSLVEMKLRKNVKDLFGEVLGV